MALAPNSIIIVCTAAIDTKIIKNNGLVNMPSNIFKLLLTLLELISLKNFLVNVCALFN